MDFTFSDEQKAMAAAVRELLADLCSPLALRKAYDDGAHAGDERWPRLVELGIPGMLAPETAGGLGLHDIDFVLVAEETGRAALPEPVAEHAGVAVPLLADLAAHSPGVQTVLTRAAACECRVALVHAQNPYVLAADEATHLVICAPDSIHLLARDAVRLTAQPSIDLLRSADPDTMTPRADT